MEALRTQRRSTSTTSLTTCKPECLGLGTVLWLAALQVISARRAIKRARAHVQAGFSEQLFLKTSQDCDGMCRSQSLRMGTFRPGNEARDMKRLTQTKLETGL